jgi:hypothetical protein
MKNRSRSTRSTSVLAVILLLFALLACRCSQPDTPIVENQNLATPAPPKVSPTPISEGELRRYLTNVAAGNADPLPNLSDDSWHKISADTRVRTDENGEGWLKLRQCMLIYLFQAGDMITAPCSKSEYASGHVNCQLSGTAVYKDSCGPQAEQLVQTPTAEVAPQGTWFTVTYLPQQQATLVMVFDGSVSVKPIRDLATRSLGEPTTVSTGQVWITAPDNRLNTDSENIGGIERTVRAVSDTQSVIRSMVGPWLERIQQRAKQDGIEGPAIQALASPSPTTPEITSEAEIDCDCNNAGGGLLARAYQRQCLQAESTLKREFRETKKVTGHCDSVASGPNAKPK